MTDDSHNQDVATLQGLQEQIEQLQGQLQQVEIELSVRPERNFLWSLTKKTSYFYVLVAFSTWALERVARTVGEDPQHIVNILAIAAVALPLLIWIFVNQRGWNTRPPSESVCIWLNRIGAYVPAEKENCLRNTQLNMTALLVLTLVAASFPIYLKLSRGDTQLAAVAESHNANPFYLQVFTGWFWAAIAGITTLYLFLSVATANIHGYRIDASPLEIWQPRIPGCPRRLMRLLIPRQFWEALPARAFLATSPDGSETDALGSSPDIRGD